MGIVGHFQIKVAVNGSTVHRPLRDVLRLLSLPPNYVRHPNHRAVGPSVHRMSGSRILGREDVEPETRGCGRLFVVEYLMNV